MSQQSDPPKNSKNEKISSAPSMKYFMHGNIFQIKILLLRLLRGWLLDEDFELITEMPEAGNFNDVVYITTAKNGKKSIWFLQAKHVQQKNEKIVFDDFVKGKSRYKSDNFKLLQYFETFKKIVNGNNEKFKCYQEKKSFIIFTNYGIDLSNLEDEGMDLNLDISEDGFFSSRNSDGTLLSQLNGKRYKIEKNICSYSIFKIEPELHQLAAELARCAVYKAKLELKPKIFNKYHRALKDHNILVSDGKQKASFHILFSTYYGDQTNENLVYKELQKLFLMYYKKNSWEMEEFIVKLPQFKKICRPRYNKERDDLKALAANVANCILNREAVELKNSLSGHVLTTLNQKVFELTDNTARFKKSFIQNNSNMGYIALKFRKFFIEEYATRLTDEMILQKIEGIKLTYDAGFAAFIEDYNCDLEEIEDFSIYISSAIKEFFKNHQPIDLQSKKEVNQLNLLKMAGKNRAIVYVEDKMNKNKKSEEKVLKFSEVFITQSDSLPSELPLQLQDLRRQIISKDVTQDQLKKFRFKIPNYYTEYEKEYQLPPINPCETKKKKNREMVDQFLDKLVLAVDQPNEQELTDIIKTELAHLFPVYDIDSVFCDLFLNILDWVTKKEVTIYTKEMFHKTLNDIRNKLSKRYIMRSADLFCIKLQQLWGSASSFSPPFQKLSQFLKSKKKVLWALVDNDKLSLSYASGILKTLKNEKHLSDNGVPECYFKSSENYIFQNLSFLLISYADIYPVVKELSCFNLIVIVDDNRESNETTELYLKLCGIENDNLKIIIITLDRSFIPFKTNDRFKHLFEEYTVNVSVKRQVEQAVKDLQSVEIEKPT